MPAHADEQNERLLDSGDDDKEERAYDSAEKVYIVGVDEGSDAEEYSIKPPPFSWRKLWLFTGPGFLMSIAFLDPGNLEGDLQAGAIAGYSLLWLLLWATAIGLLVQLLSARLGVATGRHLAELCREEYPNWARLLLWVMTEVALIGADIQEVIGSAIALKILTNGILPLWAGVIITALDCFIFLFLENYGVRKLEALFAALIAIMALSFAWMFGETKPGGGELLIGVLVPKLSSNTIQQAVGVVGCIIMPHNVFLHSALVQSREIDNHKTGRVREALTYYSIESGVALAISFVINLFVTTVFAKAFYGTAAGHEQITVSSSSRPGLDPWVLKTIPVMVFDPKEFEDGLECAVCLCEISGGEKARLLPKCNHGFHVDCIDMWFQSHSTCPLCRNPVANQIEPNPAAESALDITLQGPTGENSGVNPLPAEAPNFPANVLIWGNEAQVSTFGRVEESNQGNAVAGPSGSSSASSSSRPDGISVIDVPSQISEEEEPKSPAPTRLRSLKRLLSGNNRRVNPSSPRNLDLEQGGRGPI